jgi:TonB-linked SusC/RagA family outer membrane protein
MKKHLLVISLMFVAFAGAIAQRTISGTVSDASGETLIGASILVKGTSTGTITDFDGTYSLEVPEGATTLVFSYTGYSSQEVEIGASNTIDLVMEESAETLSEVVVTGLGIKKEKKALGYGVSTLSSDEIAGRAESDVSRILRGKATGVDIAQTSGLAGSGTNVIIRGYSSITGDNQPLFVIDGVPFNTSTQTDRGFGAGGATASSRFLDLDPNAIAEVSILKGLSATVLYGEAGRNGVILITTKNGRAGSNLNKGMEVTVNQSVSFSEVANLPDYQNTYGNGFSGGFGWFFSNWGARFDDQNPSSYGSDYKGIAPNGNVLITHPYDQSQYNDDVPEFIGADYEYKPYPSVENFFADPALTTKTSLSIENNIDENTSVSATYSYIDDGGFTPLLDEQRGGGKSNYLRKHNFGLGMQTKLSNGLKVRGTFNYVNSERRTPITAQAFGGGGNGLFAALLFTPRSIDLMNLQYQSPVDGYNIYYRRGSTIQNPRWVLNNAGDYEYVQRFFGTLEASYDIAPWLSALYRVGIDQYQLKSVREQNKGGQYNPDGFLETANRQNRITDQVMNFLYNFKLSDDFSLDGVIGANLRREVFSYTAVESTQQFVYGLFTHNNFVNHNSFAFESEENTMGVYATASLGYKNYLYFNVQARNDWTSTLEQANRSILYPSASLSFVATDAIPSLQQSDLVNYLKVRLGYGTSAGYPSPYQTRTILGTSTNVFVTEGGSILNTNSLADRLGNNNLKPELHAELELGVEARFLNNRVGVDLSLYQKTSSDLIIDLNLDPATGFTNTTVNGATVVNEGVELGLDFTPIRGKFQWDFTLNYTKNVGTVDEITGGVDQIQIAGFGGSLGNYAIPGQPYGIIQGSRFVRVEGIDELFVNAQGSYVEDAGLQIIGNPQPNYTANWINNFSYKGLSFGFQWQYIDGGDIYSSTVQALMARGNTIDTDYDRYLPLVLDGVGPDGQKNTVQTYMGDVFFDAYFGADEGGIFDATVIRLREVSLSYSLPKKVLEGTPFGSLNLSVFGENLFYNAPNFPEGINFDPEVLSVGVGNGRGFDFRTAPTSKKYGVSLNVTF